MQDHLKMLLAERSLRQLIREVLLYEVSRQNQAEEIRRRIRIFNENLNKLKENYPEAYDDLVDRHPTLVSNLEALQVFSERVDAEAVKSDPVQQAATNLLIEKFNRYCKDINFSIQSDFDPEFGLIAQEAGQALYDALFPKSYVSQAVMYYTGQRRLEDYQKWLISPAEGIERMASGLASLLNPATWMQAARGVRTLAGMNAEERSLALKALEHAWNDISTEDKARGVFSWIFSVLTLLGGAVGVAKLTSLSPITLDVLVTAARITSNAPLLRGLPAAVISGIFLEPIETE